MKPTSVFQTVSELIKEEFKHILDVYRTSADEKNTKAITRQIQRRCHKGWKYCSSQKFDDALLELRAAHALAIEAGIENATVSWLELELGIILDFSGLSDEAVEHFDRGLRLNGTFPCAGDLVARAQICAAAIQATKTDYVACFDYVRNLSPSQLVDLDPYFKIKFDWLMDTLLWHYGGRYESVDELLLFDFVFQVGHVAGERLIAASGTVRRLCALYPHRVLSAKTKQLIEQLSIPQAPLIAERKPVSEEIHSTLVADDFRWLETASEERNDWCQRNNLYALSLLGSTEWSFLAAAKGRISQDMSSVGVPYQLGAYWFYWLRKPREYGRSFYCAKSLAEEPIKLISHEELDKSNLSFKEAAVSPTGVLVAYCVAKHGSDWGTWHISRVPGGEPLPDEIHGVRGCAGIAWSRDETGIFYLVHLEADGRFQNLRFHKLGTECAEDIDVFEGECGVSYSLQLVDDFIVLYVLPDEDVNYGIFYRKASDSDSAFQPLLPHIKARQWVVDHDDGKFFLITSWDAPNNRVISVSITTGEVEEVVPETEAVLQFAGSFTRRLHRVLAYEWAGSASLMHLQQDGIREKLSIPVASNENGCVTQVDFMNFSGFKVCNEEHFCFRAESYCLPPTIYKYDVTDHAMTRAFAWQTPTSDYDPALFVTKQITATSADGTPVPVFVCHHRDTVLNGDHPTWLTAYGGFRIGVRPTFSSQVISWIENGGIFAEALVRGGHEFGDQWHQDARQLGRPNITDDFIAAAEALISGGYTSANKLGVSGVSNGGLLVASAMVKRPELFGCAVMRAGLFDLVRFHKFGFGRQWKSEYGDPDDPLQFASILSISPLHNIVPARYPATLIQVPTCDDRVDPCHSLKLFAALQNAQLGDAPILLRQYEGEGHGLNGKPSYLAPDLEAFLATYAGLSRAPRLN